MHNKHNPRTKNSMVVLLSQNTSSLLRHEHLKKLYERVRHEGVFVGYKQPCGSIQYLVLVRKKYTHRATLHFLKRARLCHGLVCPVLLWQLMCPLSMLAHILQCPFYKRMTMTQTPIATTRITVRMLRRGKCQTL